VVAVLDRLGVPYERMPIDPDYADTGPFCEKYGVPLEHSANTIIVASKKEPKQYAACVVKATRRLDVNHAVRRLMGVARLSFASSDETRTLTGMMLGGVTVLGAARRAAGVRGRHAHGPAVGHPRQRQPRVEDPDLTRASAAPALSPDRAGTEPGGPGGGLVVGWRGGRVRRPCGSASSSS
jgi:aminoacyl-tRNA editing protein